MAASGPVTHSEQAVLLAQQYHPSAALDGSQLQLRINSLSWAQLHNIIHCHCPAMTCIKLAGALQCIMMMIMD